MQTCDVECLEATFQSSLLRYISKKDELEGSTMSTSANIMSSHEAITNNLV